MGIDLRIEDEKGRPHHEVSDPKACVPRFLAMSDTQGTVCLQFIDPYGDTVFNRLQLEALHTEVSTALPVLSVERLREARAHTLSEAIRLKWQDPVIERLREGIGSAASHLDEVGAVTTHMHLVLDAIAKALAMPPHFYVRLYGD